MKPLRLLLMMLAGSGLLHSDPTRSGLGPRPGDAEQRSRTPSRQQVQPEAGLTLDQALELAERLNPRFRVAEASVEGGKAQAVTARAYLNPEFTAGGFGGQQATQISAIPGMIDGFALSQPLEWPSVRKARIYAAELRRTSTGYGMAETRLAVRATVKQAFYDALRRKGEIELARGNLDLLEDLQHRIAVQVKVGEAARLELVRADAEVATGRIQLESARLRLNAALAGLRSAIGAPPYRVLDPEDKLDAKIVLPDLAALTEHVLNTHPTIALANLEAQRASALLRLERELVRPQPTVWADMFRQPDAAQYRIGVTFPLPIWNKRQGPIAEAVAAERYADATVTLRRLEISAALESAYGQYEIASQQVAMFETGTLREAEAAVQGAQAAFRLGERGIIEVLDAQRVLRGARLDYLNAQFDRQSALIDLERLGAVDLGARRP